MTTETIQQAKLTFSNNEWSVDCSISIPGASSPVRFWISSKNYYHLCSPCCAADLSYSDEIIIPIFRLKPGFYYCSECSRETVYRDDTPRRIFLASLNKPLTSKEKVDLSQVVNEQLEIWFQNTVDPLTAIYLAAGLNDQLREIWENNFKDFYLNGPVYYQNKKLIVKDEDKKILEISKKCEELNSTLTKL